MGEKYCVGSFIVDGHKFLFGKRSESKPWYPGVWDVFGGHSQPGESVVDTLKRELTEELSILPTVYQLFSTVDVFDERESGTMRYYIYFVTSWIGIPKNCSDEHSEIKWFSRDELHHTTLASPKYPELLDAWNNSKKNNDDAAVSKFQVSP